MSSLSGRELGGGGGVYFSIRIGVKIELWKGLVCLGDIEVFTWSLCSGGGIGGRRDVGSLIYSGLDCVESSVICLVVECNLVV